MPEPITNIVPESRDYEEGTYAKAEHEEDISEIFSEVRKGSKVQVGTSARSLTLQSIENEG